MTNSKNYKRFTYDNDKFGIGIESVYGVKSEGEPEIQAIHFLEDKFTEDQAKSWLTKNKKSGSFELAKVTKSGFVFIPHDSVVSACLGDVSLESWVCGTNNIISLCERGVIGIDTDFDTFAVEMVNSRYRDKQSEGDVWLYEIFDFDVTEAKFDNTDGGKALSLRIIQGDNGKYNGISKNNNYYSSEVIEALMPHLEQRSKMYLNHQTRESAKRGEPRDMKDWTATIKETWVNDGGAYVKADMCDNHNGWLYTEAQKHPEQIGVSIDAYVVAKKGKVHGQECTIVEKWHFLNSADFVGDPSAGGITMGISEQEQQYATALCNLAEHVNVNANKSGSPVVTVGGDIKKLFEETYKEKFDKGIERAKFNEIWYTAEDMIRYGIINDKDMTDDEKKSAIGEVIDLLKTYILDLNFEDIKYSFEAIINNRKNIIGGDSAVKTEEILEVLKTATFDQLKQAGNEVVLSEAKNEAEKTVEGTIKSKEENHTKVVKEKDEKITALEKDIKDRDEKLSKIEEDKRIIDNGVKIDKFLVDNKIDRLKIIPSHIENLKKMGDEDLGKALEELKTFIVKIKDISVNLTTQRDLEANSNDNDNGGYSQKKLAKVLGR